MQVPYSPSETDLELQKKQAIAKDIQQYAKIYAYCFYQAESALPNENALVWSHCASTMFVQVHGKYKL
jgi:hypothetical protein